MAKLADAPDSGFGAGRHGGSSPFTRTRYFLKNLTIFMGTYHLYSSEFELWIWQAGSRNLSRILIHEDSEIPQVSKTYKLKRKGYIGFILIGIIHLYRYTFSALIGRNCRFLPTCSEYMIEAIKLHGVVKGAWLGLKRLLRCQPYGSDGFDPVPPEMPNRPKNIKKENP